MQIIKTIKNFSRLPQLICYRNTVYSTNYAEPTTSLDQINDIIESTTDLNYRPIKALKNDLMSFTFDDPLLNKFTNMVMMEADKKLAKNLMAKAFQAIKWKQIRELYLAQLEDKNKDSDSEVIETNPLKIFHLAVKNAAPLMWLMNVKRGGTTYQVPCPINPKHSQFRALKWILEAARDKDGKILFEDKLAWELIDASENQGSVIKKKRDLHALCETNKAYAHFRWGK
ncbi:unnamed protein product [Gordionus sp. m RMFG-2023]|uniref:small ribosomal subunit protein uS7m-like isoform X2 n=1 Tax=Gordionus sp. m RMFG-2023 TaxID=3053472 RepID=UPI0030E18958